jgi:hypothetical protein
MYGFAKARNTGVVVTLFGFLFITSCAALKEERVDFAQLSQFGIFPCDDSTENKAAEAAWMLSFQNSLSNVADYQPFEVTSFGRCKFRVLGSSERGPTQFDPVNPAPQSGTGPDWNVFVETFPLTLGALSQRFVDQAKEACAAVSNAGGTGPIVFSERGLCIRTHLNRTLRRAEYSTVVQGRANPLREVLILSYRGRVVGLAVQESLLSAERPNVILEYAFAGMSEYWVTQFAP